jgi:hypothetical protein
MIDKCFKIGLIIIWRINMIQNLTIKISENVNLIF